MSGSRFYVISPTCARCGTKHDSMCLVDTNDGYWCGSSDPKIRDCSVFSIKGNEKKKFIYGSF